MATRQGRESRVEKVSQRLPPAGVYRGAAAFARRALNRPLSTADRDAERIRPQCRLALGPDAQTRQSACPRHEIRVKWNNPRRGAFPAGVATKERSERYIEKLRGSGVKNQRYRSDISIRWMTASNVSPSRQTVSVISSPTVIVSRMADTSSVVVTGMPLTAVRISRFIIPGCYPRMHSGMQTISRYMIPLSQGNIWDGIPRTSR